MAYEGLLGLPRGIGFLVVRRWRRSLRRE